MLPEWIQPFIDTIPDTITIDKVGDYYFLSNNPSTSYSTVEEAYMVVSDSHIPFRFGSGFHHSDYHEITDDSGNTYVLFGGFTKEFIIEGLEDSYQEFLDYERAYVKDPSCPVACYQYLNTHPAFWVRTPSPKGMWDTDAAFDRFTFAVYRDAHDGSPVFRLEGGEHVSPDYEHTYLNLALTAFADNWNDMVVAFAANVYRDYDSCGVTREGAAERAADAADRLLR